MAEPVNPPAPPEPTPAPAPVDPPAPPGDGGVTPDPTTLLGGSEPPPAPELDADGKPKGEVQTDPKDAKPQGAPEKYDLTPPEGVTLDPAMLEKFEPLARELNLSNEDANKLLPLATELLQNQQKVQAEAWSKQIADWSEAVKADKVLGGENLPQTLKSAGRFMDWLGMDDLRALLNVASPENPNGLGIGNHPVLVAAFAKAGKAMAEDGFIPASRESAGKKDLAHQMYPQMP